MGILSVDLDKTNLNENNKFYEDDPEAIIHARLLAWQSKLKQCEAFKKDISKEWMPVAWYPTRWWIGVC